MKPCTNCTACHGSHLSYRVSDCWLRHFASWIVIASTSSVSRLTRHLLANSATFTANYTWYSSFAGTSNTSNESATSLPGLKNLGKTPCKRMHFTNFWNSSFRETRPGRELTSSYNQAKHRKLGLAIRHWSNTWSQNAKKGWRQEWPWSKDKLTCRGKLSLYSQNKYAATSKRVNLSADKYPTLRKSFKNPKKCVFSATSSTRSKSKPNQGKKH